MRLNITVTPKSYESSEDEFAAAIKIQIEAVTANKRFPA